MKIEKIEIKIQEKYFVDYNALHNESYLEKIKKNKKEFLENNKDIEIIEDKEVRSLDYNNKPKDGEPYSGYYLKYYIGEMQIKGSKVSMKVNLNKKIMDLALKEAGGEIKELVKKEYEEFENQIYALIDKTEKKNIFGNFVVSKFKKLKEAILNNSNKQL